MNGRYLQARGSVRDLPRAAQPPVQRQRSARVRRGVPFHGDPRPAWELLRARQREGQELQGQLQTLFDALNIHLPALDFLHNNTTVPDDVRAMALRFRNGCMYLSTSLGEALAALRPWTRQIRRLCDRLGQANALRPIGFSGEGLDEYDGALLGSLNSLFRQVNRGRAEMAQTLANMGDFLQKNIHYLRTDQTLGCGPASAGGLPRPGDPGGGGADGPGAGGGIGVQAAGSGLPAGINSCTAAYYTASWETHARMFQQGTPIAHDLHHRRYAFSDKSYLDIQAHVPQLGTSMASNLAVMGSGVVGGLGGAWLGAVLGGTFTVLGALVGGATAMLAHSLARPDDVVSQCYTVRYYLGPQAPQPWAVRGFYGWKKSPDVTKAVDIDGIRDPARMPNMADHAHDYSWWRWRSGEAAVRPPQFDGCDAGVLSASPQAPLDAKFQQLLQAWSAFGQSGAGSAPVIPATLVTQTVPVPVIP